MADNDKPHTDGDDDAYVLDLEETADADVDALTREALAAVSARRDDPEDEKGVATIPGEEATPDAAVTELQTELADLRDRSIRTLADFENYRRRSERERDELKRFAQGLSLIHI